MKFTWDENKRQTNLKKHQLDFADAEKVFAGDVLIFEDIRFDYGEQRWVAMGLLDVLLVVIIHVESTVDIRIISMRKATKNEISRFRGLR
jgi:uncharacterized DUF497 family protein